MILNFDINKKNLKNKQILQLWLCGAIIQLIKTAADYAVTILIHQLFNTESVQLLCILYQTI